ncbi:outer membrane lipid asymmetry maintenance protein MlaD [Desulfovermiculus halophilus]|jgi:phospholipid/cholesterol/gamma-HCH transport system substrate-binding protein|uniref:outer membrane lipid asymmetry maintenance protein MlaD n=1 Tax=Desulfovermiculus halophilus TaxID=339722 RepID=UPI000487AF41|nr:outer membrane lipid asymmetry maintenance protein MlaD [Desulfovermiculus halophilus]
MSSRYAVETSVGVFVLVALLCVGYLTIQLGDFDFFGADTYRIKARFNSVSGLKVGNEVQIAGVSVGKVEEIDLNTEQYVAIVTMSIDQDVELLDDSMAAVKTSGLIGDKYISISPGGVGLPMESGDMIIDTQSPIDVEELVGKYVFGGADDESK